MTQSHCCVIYIHILGLIELADKVAMCARLNTSVKEVSPPSMGFNVELNVQEAVKKDCTNVDISFQI